MLEVLILNQVKPRMEAYYSELILPAKLCTKKLSSGIYDLYNLATFALNFPNMNMNIMQSEIFNISLFSMIIFNFKMLNHNVSSLLSCIQWLWHCTVLGYTTGWVIRSLISSKWVFNHSYGLPGVFKVQILCLDLFLDQNWSKFGLRSPKNVQKLFYRIVDLMLLFLALK